MEKLPATFSENFGDEHSHERLLAIFLKLFLSVCTQGLDGDPDKLRDKQTS